MTNDELDLLLEECLNEINTPYPDPIFEEYQSPDPSELPKPLLFPYKDLVLILSDDTNSTSMIKLLKPYWDKFEIVYNTNNIPNLQIIGFPTVYCRKTKTSHLGVTDYKSLINFFKSV